DDFFFYWIPFQRPAQPVGDVAQVADGDASRADFDVADRPAAIPDAVDPVGGVIARVVQVNFVGTQRLFEQRFGRRFDVAAIHLDPALVADEKHAVDLAIFITEGQR